ncbi:hypothetical protein [Aminipila terrae]|uniref:Uncharacterized protein n=1 Tax=Aminipila terrae TaxID=2697030 RepID=A0A6P1MKX0_9FIRM|nr:hypothetical protein [Aminipila terrae]QHI73803.1 hypothetical protein Ami3637_16700 [Aminipila terrae]
MINSPCKGCTDRYVGCHGKCAEYISFATANTERRELIKKQVFVDCCCEKVRKDSVTRAYRGLK